MFRTAIAAALLLAAPASAQDRQALEASIAPLAESTAVFVIGDGSGHGAAKGWADQAGKRPLTVDTPMRIASNTKTFVAATVLRLWEQGGIDLDAPIRPLIAPALDAKLNADGYDTTVITVRHLLSHSAGLYDHGGDPRFEAAMRGDPGHRWTRETLIGLMTEYADPKSAPGVQFSYSDDGYILLGDIVERITGKNLAAAVREQLRLDALGLNSTYWEVFERPRPGAEPRARQFLGTADVTAVDASFDLYGGGGLVMSARDLARFFKALFEGKVFARPQTLGVMLGEGGHKGADTYRFGIFVRHTPRGDIYWHSGFWGTWAGYSPETGTAVVGMTTNQQGFRAMLPVLNAALAAKR
jgi:D-alanyl-D-alanine carboxypeptidase